MKENVSGCFFLNTVYIQQACKIQQISATMTVTVAYFCILKMIHESVRLSVLSVTTLGFRGGWGNRCTCFFDWAWFNVSSPPTE